MAALYVLIPIAVVLVALAIWVFFWAVDSGQYDDLEGPAHSILFDDDLPPPDSGQKAETTDETPPERPERD
ncbi:cbb3-type cytochrome oxidase assembly protein CcoS [Stutzerimonas kirkiae]|uniref:Cbb3-type cytochrome oxidase assembly protein CcoS n=1 Tax=Stutzerimonas kirkiae TaxID=2211392 RepID=A0A4Q9R2R7_9GAMM|nr:cbb3-type cytochrome oxidase assembly protein CcoS [Stutzerimonas kirkiae]TBU93516.1 cbb3-type cytochrome oxidase assembly protein CcoS [Stutzerimonas kirkiae]TBV01722.1 cbb3-type cytochrome oxidase assembly protein CcoS [Stutzerimonas kirkiae]TBV07420.1 cbb3-type cytochrome oxidase assembly protein CcoS [Stutzerimonas kirkiae]TBV11053.1 cbb3-type cytochrome oxidase assembly protein CcoS [Stutzerimonas kirkiae]